MELEQLKQENEKLTARLNKAVEVFKEQKANIDALTNQRDELLMNVDACKKSYDELNEEKEQLKTQLEEVKNAQSTITVVGENETDYKEKYSGLAEKFDSLEAEHEALKAEYNNTVTKAADLNDILDKIKRDYEQTQIDLLAAEECNSRNNKELLVADEKIKGFDQELKSLQALNDDLNKQLDQYEIKLSSAETKNAELTDKVTEYTKAYSQSKDIISKQTAEIEDLKKQVKGLEAYETKFKNQDAAYEELRKNFVASQEEAENKLSLFKSFIKDFIERGNDLYYEKKPRVHTAVKETSNNQFMSDAPGFTI